MLAAMEALITLGTCREVPVVGFVGGMLVTGIIVSPKACMELWADLQDELQRNPIDKSADQPQTRSTRQTALTSFFSPTKPRPQPVITERVRTHKVYVSDSKTRAKDSLPKEEDTLAGQLQCMMYKELLDAMLLSASTSGLVAGISPMSGGELSEEPTASTSNRPSARPLAFDSVFRHLSIDPAEPFSDRFLSQSVPIIAGNGLRMGASSARNLSDMVVVWERYVVELGLGTPSSPSTAGPSSPAKSAKAKGKAKADDNGGRTETRLELVYRRAGQKKTKGKSKRRRQDKMADDGVDEMAEAEPGVKEKAEEARVAEEERLVQLAIEESLKTAPQLQEEAAGSEEFLSDPPRPADTIHGTPQADVHVTLAAGELPVSIARPPSHLSEYHMDRTSDEEREDAEIAWAVEMSLVDAQLDDTPGEVAVPLSQRSDVAAPPPAPVVEPSPQASPRSARSRSSSPTPPPSTGTTSGSIIGRHRFQHNIELLERHLASVLQYWHGQREPIGVQLKDTGRCGWCEFEEGCEWR
jgi:exonuclease V